MIENDSSFGLHQRLEQSVINHLGYGVRYEWAWVLAPSHEWESVPREEIYAFRVRRCGVYGMTWETVLYAEALEKGTAKAIEETQEQEHSHSRKDNAVYRMKQVGDENSLVPGRYDHCYPEEQ